MNKSLLLTCLLIGAFCLSKAQSLTGEVRSHWNKASIYIENAANESEWRLAVSELMQVVKLAPDFAEAFLKLGDAYSHVNTSESVEKAKYYWKEYVKRVPTANTDVQDKIDQLEAEYEISLLRNRDIKIESLIGRWRNSRENAIDFGQDRYDIEFFRQGNKLMLRYVSVCYFYTDIYDWGWEGGGVRSTESTSYMEIPVRDDGISIQFDQIQQDRWRKNGTIEKIEKDVFHFSFFIAQPALDGVIKGCYEIGGSKWDLFLYKVN